MRQAIKYMISINISRPISELPKKIQTDDSIKRVKLQRDLWLAVKTYCENIIIKQHTLYKFLIVDNLGHEMVPV